MNIIDVPIKDLISFEESGIPDCHLLRQLNYDHVEHLVAMELQNVPPITVTRYNDRWLVVGGYHRLEAAKLLKRESIRAISKNYSSTREMVEDAFTDNLEHGLILTKEDKASYAYWLSKTYPHMTHEDIAKKVKLERSSVSKILKKYREQLEAHERAEDLDEQEDREYAHSQVDYTVPLIKALSNFTKNEASVMGEKASELKRAKVIVSSVPHTKANADFFESLSRTFATSAKILREKVGKKPSK
jgi:hypothetical protein